MKNLIIVLIVFLSTQVSFAQKGSIKGTVTFNENGETAPMARIALLQANTLVASIRGDLDGNFTFKDLNPGNFDVQIRYVGYEIAYIKDVIVSADKISIVNNVLEERILIGCCFGGCKMARYKNPAVP